jgi:hypothetical protein
VKTIHPASRVTHLLLFTTWIALTALGQGSTNDLSRSWPAWRGPLANGVAPHANPPIEWSEKKNVRWKVALPGNGHSSQIGRASCRERV